MKFEDTMKVLNALTNNLISGDTQPSKDESDEFTFFFVETVRKKRFSIKRRASIMKKYVATIAESLGI